MSWHGSDYAAFAQKISAAVAAHPTLVGILTSFVIGVVVGAVVF
jgi:hypothetical protein